MANKIASYQTKTASYLMKSAMLTSLDAVKYMLFSDVATKEHHPQTASFFEKISSYKCAHTEILLRYLGQIGDTAENLQNGKSEADGAFFREGATYAREDGYYEIADAMEAMANISEQIDATVKENATAPSAMPSDTIWQCENCGQQKNGNLPPERCMLCGKPQSYFTSRTV